MSEPVRRPTCVPASPSERFAARTAGMTASEIRALFAVASRPEVVSLAGGMPNLAALPLDALAAEVADLVAREGQVALQYGSAQGRPELREQICEVMALEGIRADPDDVVVTVGSQMALDLVTRIYCDPGDVVLAEGPSYVGALGSFAAYQARVVHVAMDAHGLVPDAAAGGAARAGRPRVTPKFLYTIPNFHNPAGVTLAVERRAEVLAICAGVRRRRRRGQPVRAARLQRAHLSGAALARPRRRLPGLVLQDVRVRAAGGLGAGAARGARPAGAGRRVGDALPAELHPDAGLAVPGRPRLAQPGQDVHRGLPRPPRRHAARAGDLPAARLHVERARRRLLRVAHRARGRRHEGDAAARGHRAGRLRVGHRVLRRRFGSRQLRLSYCYPTPGADHRGRAPAGRGAGGGARRDAHVRQPGPPRLGRGPQAPSPSTP